MLERTLLRHFPNGILILCDHDLRWVVVDGEELGRTDRAASELEGRRIDEIYPPEVCDWIEPFIRRCLAGEIVSYEADLRGRRYFVQGIPVVEDGVVRYAALSTQEVGELRAKLGELEGRYRALLENLPGTVVMVVDRDLRYIHADGRSEFLGRTADEMLVERPEVIEMFRRALEGSPQSSEYRNLRGDKDYWLQIVPVRREDGSIVGAMSVAQDITERVQMERDLAAARRNEALGALAAGVAHDFNNLLQAISGHTALALAEVPEGTKARDRLQTVAAAAEQAAALARKMLQYSGARGLELAETDLSDLARLAAAGRDVSLRLADGLPPVRGDIAQLAQVPTSLIENAIEARGTVTLTTGAEDGFVYLEVSDDGDGMDADTQARMFEPFFSTRFTGRGLGLAAVEGIVRGHNGHLRVESAPGEGTRVRVLLPAA